MENLAFLAPAVGIVLPYITQFAKKKRGMDGKKVILILSGLAAFIMHLLNYYVGEAALDQFFANMAQIVSVAVTYYNFFIKKTESK